MQKNVLFLILLLMPFLRVTAQHFDYLDVFDLQFAVYPEISPDGNKIAYVRQQMDVQTDRKYSNIWMIDHSGGQHVALTSGKASHYGLQWSPDGRCLAYISTAEGKSQLFVRWMDTGTSTAITNVAGSPSGLRWSPDGRYLLFSQSVAAPAAVIGQVPSPPKGAQWAAPAQIITHVRYKRDGAPIPAGEAYTHLFIVSAEGGAPRQLTSGNTDHGNALWAPDGKHILYTADYSATAATDINNERIYELNLDSGARKMLLDRRGPYQRLSLSPDGRQLAFTGFEDRFLGYQQTELYVMQREGSGLRVISEKLDRDIGQIDWSADGKGLYFQYDEYGVSKMAYMSLQGQVTEIVQGLGGASIGRPYTDGTFSVAADGRFVISATNPQMPAELVAGQYPAKQGTRQLTQLNRELLQAKPLGLVQEFWVNSSVDKMKVQGWIITPPDFDPARKYPMILEIHGGPYTAYGPSFTPELQLMASKGYVVVYTNPRGSTSYGAEFAAYINHNYPSEDYNDLMDCVDYVLKQGYVDDKRLFITGGSGGGVLTAWAIGKTDRFAAAVVAKPVINWYTHTLTADAYPFFSKYWFKQKPWEDMEEYMKRSPISLVGNVKTPTMLITGEQDHRTPMSESEQYFQALQLRGVRSALIRIPDEGHEMTARPSNLLRKVAHILGWFAG
jgi:dipeptidyl aminopeptidase/acylaminoacyl peptidase